MEAKREIETSFGTLFARVYHSDIYPAIGLCLKRPSGESEEFCLLEVDEGEKKLKAHVWGTSSDAPLYSSCMDMDEILKLFGEV